MSFAYSPSLIPLKFSSKSGFPSALRVSQNIFQNDEKKSILIFKIEIENIYPYTECPREHEEPKKIQKLLVFFNYL